MSSTHFSSDSTVSVIGGGLAGCEAALQLAARGMRVRLHEMRPHTVTPAHETDRLAELVCSNSLKSLLPGTAAGLLKAELRQLGCRLLPIAESCRVPAGNALAVDRDAFACAVTREVEAEPLIEVIRGEVGSLPAAPAIIATGPLTSESLTAALLEAVGEEQLYFFDAIAPIIDADSLDHDVVYRATRYDKGDADYLNCPFDKEQYERFVIALREGEKHEAHEFESRFFSQLKWKFYENCIPVEELARRGDDTLRYGVLRPVGLNDPRSGRRPWAVLQLRSENAGGTAWNLVGCQTMLRQGEQQRVFRLVPGLERARFLRYGSIHRNTYLHTPALADETLSLKSAPGVRLAGQLAGVEGYVESIFGGWLAAALTAGPLPLLPDTTISGQLWRHMITPSDRYQPMNANFGLLPPLPERIRDKKLKKAVLAARALDDLKKWVADS
ncbi:MAG: methylenetetrahydrofolate--tRNA-(uracil(54)-C(5))-methyltransferase (FADH(2)-oxidizing) TrmFO [Candidatus Cloacimonetes bacterium]|nr:methylenetetrahydrofolate--tRNA-(uracil(54)-C(5))-methyltransferase (FADH(2)-oxidizing) TrmFO [Candidatus Cloacimonadota bacterium]